MGSSSIQFEKCAYTFLAFPVSGKQKIVLIAPNHSEVDEVTCDLIVVNTVIATRTSRFRDEIVRLYEFEFEDLVEGGQYHYQFRTPAGPLILGGDLEAVDLNFFYYSRISSSDTAILVSCNGVNDFHNRTLSPFGMWERMFREVAKLPQRPRLLINGGDQYYQDAVENDWLSKLSDDNFASLRANFKRASLENALAHMNNGAYRKLMAQIPSIAMLDDHDITDGAGGRSEYFVENEFTPEYKNYLSVQLELFELLQASRNPAPIAKIGHSGFSFSLDLGESAIVALDLRTQKNSKKTQLMENDTETAVFETIELLPHKNVMILIPVVPFRNARDVEDKLVTATRIAAEWAAKIVPRGWFNGKLKASLLNIAGYEDDLLDALSSESNAAFMSRLLKTLSKQARKGVQYTVLSGDIHTGGTVESKVKVEDFTFKLPIIVSSPIGYQPMHHLVEAFLRERKLVTFEKDGVFVRGLIDAFTTQRNFVMFRPALLGTNEANNACVIFQEEVPGAKVMQLDSWIEPATDDEASGKEQLIDETTPKEPSDKNLNELS